MDVLLAIHRPDLRLAIDLFLREESGVNVVGVASSTEGLMALLSTTGPALLLLDWSLPGRPLVDVLTEAHRLDTPPKIIVLGKDENDREAVLAAGANAFVVKGEPPAQLLSAIRRVSTPSGPSETEEAP